MADTLIARSIVSSERRDRMGDVIVQSGAILDDFTRNPVALYAHGDTPAMHAVVGRWSDFRGVKVRGIPATSAQITFDLGDEVGRRIAGLWERRALNSTSIGFQPEPDATEVIDGTGRVVGTRAAEVERALKSMPRSFVWRRTMAPDGVASGTATGPEAEIRALMGEGDGLKFNRWRLLEISIVPVPANADATREDVETVARMLPRMGIVTDGDDLGIVARALKQTTIEQCPRCMLPVAYSRAAGRLLNHVRPDGQHCDGVEPAELGGVSVKRLLALMGDSLGHDARGVADALLAEGALTLPLAMAADQATARLEMVTRQVAKGLSAEGMAIANALLQSIDAAAAALRGALEATTTDDEVEPEAEAVTPAPPEVELTALDVLSTPAAQSILERAQSVLGRYTP